MPFDYFGTKTRLANTYPVARYDTIVEPFAGAAAYSLQGDHWTRNIVLIDSYKPVVNLWKWLQAVDESAVLSLPDLLEGTFTLDPAHPAFWMMQWFQGRGSDRPRFTPSPWQIRDWPRYRRRVAADIHKIRHWHIIEGDYTDAPDIEATWFIDPPYRHQGHQYLNGSSGINYEYLAEWSMTRQGQAVVCEQEPADWLPFEHHRSHKTQSNNIVSELIWTNEPPLRLF